LSPLSIAAVVPPGNGTESRSITAARKKAATSRRTPKAVTGHRFLWNLLCRSAMALNRGRLPLRERRRVRTWAGLSETGIRVSERCDHVSSKSDSSSPSCIEKCSTADCSQTACTAGALPSSLAAALLDTQGGSPNCRVPSSGCQSIVTQREDLLSALPHVRSHSGHRLRIAGFLHLFGDHRCEPLPFDALQASDQYVDSDHSTPALRAFPFRSSCTAACIPIHQRVHTALRKMTCCQENAVQRVPSPLSACDNHREEVPVWTRSS